MKRLSLLSVLLFSSAVSMAQKEPLIERFGQEWYDELLVVAEEMKKQGLL